MATGNFQFYVEAEISIYAGRPELLVCLLFWIRSGMLSAGSASCGVTDLCLPALSRNPASEAIG